MEKKNDNKKLSRSVRTVHTFKHNIYIYYKCVPIQETGDTGGEQACVELS